VVFRDEIPLLRVQAQSINQYIQSNEIGTITVVVNDTEDVVDLVDVSWYNHPNVNVVHYSKWNYKCRVNGWESQQLCKLLAASEASSPWSLVLDSKTWFIKPFVVAEFFDQYGLPKVGRCPVIPVFKSSQEYVEQLFDVKMDTVVGPHGVPFLFHTETTKELIESQIDFPDFFQTAVRYPHLIIEFHLYSAFVIKKYGSLDAIYSTRRYYTPVNIATFEIKDFDEKFESMKEYNVSTVSVHRNVYPELSESQRQKWVDFLVEKQVLTDPSYLKIG
jgi:hypothetical protein